ncbi:MAG: VWA domain-containing protein [Planctomycetaceae bacterium]|nr:VWA domain-containing protein [Planctomycetaceae bacterium]
MTIPHKEGFVFAPFFTLLRARGLEVTLSEWLTFVEAMDKGLVDANFTQFYYLSRSILVKSEADYDKYDSVFLEYFKDIADDSNQLPKELLEWLNNPAIFPFDAKDLGRGDLFKNFSEEAIEKMFRERLAEQKEEHNGGTYWIGTHGASPFGNAGETNNGIRVGGQSRKRLAMEVAGERKYRDFRRDAELNTRSFQLALRRLRQNSNRVDAPRTELDLDATIRATGDRGGILDLVFAKPRKNTVKLMLLMDSGGSMDPYSRLCATLFGAVSKSNHFKDLKVYYFHNCFRRRFYKSPTLDDRDAVPTEWILANIDAEYKVIVVGDALMSPRELTGGYYPGKEIANTGLTWLRAFRQKYKRMVWFTPENNEYLEGGYWGQTYFIIKKEVDTCPLTVENLAEKVKTLMVAR